MRLTKTGKPIWAEGVDPAAYAVTMDAWQRRTWAASVADASAHAHAFTPWMTRLQIDAAAADRRIPFKLTLRCACAPEPPFFGPRDGGRWWRESDNISPSDNSGVAHGPRDLREALEAAHGALRAARRAAAADPGDGVLAMKLRRAKAQWRAARSAWVRAVEAEARRQTARDHAAG